MEIFKDCMEKMYTKTFQKDIGISGDFNIDLKRFKQHKPTEDFLNTMYSYTLFLKITKPTKITSYCATLIVAQY